MGVDASQPSQSPRAGPIFTDVRNYNFLVITDDNMGDSSAPVNEQADLSPNPVR
jgi:hypothetical protein